MRIMKIRNVSRFYRHLFNIHWDWLRLKNRYRNYKPKECGLSLKRLLIVPADVKSPLGSRGDQAMILATLTHFQQRYCGIKVSIITSTHNDDMELRGFDIEPLFLWKGLFRLSNIMKATTGSFDFCVVIGADCMDGHYSPIASTYYVALADLMMRVGIETRVLGFSFNDMPSKWLKLAFARLSKRVTLRLRDEVSLQRFKKFSKHRSVELVADSAFCLEESINFYEFKKIKAWCDRQRQAGRTVVAVNLHPMFSHLAAGTALEKWCEDMSSTWKLILEQNNVSLILLPHDSRAGVNDNTCLELLNARIAPVFPKRILWIQQVFRSDQVKALTRLCDCVFSSRMHLAIASLGQGVPVMCFVYQGKFDGLRLHFELPKELFIDPSQVTGEVFVSRFETFLASLPSLRKKIAVRLPIVKALAQRNFT